MLMPEQTPNASELKQNEKPMLVPVSSEKPALDKVHTNDASVNLQSTSPNTTADDQLEEEPKIGLKGYLRLLKILLSFVLFGARLFWNRRDLRLRKIIPDSPTFHTEGANLR